MLFSDVSHSLIKAISQGAAVSANNARKADAAKRLDYYQDVQLVHLQAELARHYTEPERLTPCFVNIIKKTVDLLAMAYCEPPKRTIEGSQRDQDTWAEIAESASLDAKTKEASRLTKLLKTMLIRPVWRNGRMDIDLLTPDILDVETGDSPEDLRAVLITHQADQASEVTFSLWTPDTFQKLNYRGQVIEQQDNPYGILPFVPAWDHLPSADFWTEGGADLVTIQEAINHALTSLLYTCRQQGFGVGYVRSNERGGSITVSPGSMVDLGPDGELGFASPNAPIEEILAVIDSLHKWAAVSNHLPASSLSTEPTEESGVSKLVSNSELQEIRRDDVELWRRYEKALFNVVRTVWNVHNPGRKISETATLSIDFVDPKPNTSEKEKAETWEKLLSLEVISPVDIVMQRNPDLSRDEALAYLLQVRDENAQLSERTI